MAKYQKDKVDLLDHADYVTFCIGTNDALLPFEFFVMQYEDYFYGYSGAGDDSLLWGKINKRHLSGTLRRQTGLRKII